MPFGLCSDSSVLPVVGEKLPQTNITEWAWQNSHKTVFTATTYLSEFHKSQNILLLIPPPPPLKNVRINLILQAVEKQGVGWIFSRCSSLLTLMIDGDKHYGGKKQ